MYFHSKCSALNASAQLVSFAGLDPACRSSELQRMSQKAQTGSFPEGQPAGQAEPSFASLPEPVVAHIAHLSKIKPGWPGHPLLQVSRSGRDAVLSSCTKVTLNTAPATQQASKACARLLHRACCQAPPGLCLDLLLMKHSDSPPYLLPQLLQPGLSSGGWRNVHELQVGVPRGLQPCGPPCRQPC
jgi:hypothetical protein